MPKIATYGNNRVTSEVVRGPKAQTLNLDYGLNTALKAGQMIAGEWQGSIDKANTAEAEQSLLAYEKGYNELMFNPNTGYLNTKGRDAYDAQGDVTTNLDKLKRDTVATIKSDKARELFLKSADAHEVRVKRDIMRHAGKGLNDWELQNSTAIVENSVGNAVLYYNQGDELAVQHDTGVLALQEKLNLQGVTGDTAKKAKADYTSSFYTAAVTRAIADNSAEGQKLFDKYKDNLNGEDTLRLLNKIKTVKHSDGVILKTDELMSKYATDPRDINYTAASAEIDKIEDPVERSRVKKTWRSSVSASVRQYNADAAEAVDMFDEAIQNGNDVYKVIAANPDQWARIPEAKKRKLEAGSYTVTDPLIMGKLASLPRNEFLQVDVNAPQYLGVLSKADRKSIIDSQKAIKEGKGQTFVHTKHQVISNNITDIFGDKKKWNKDTRKRASEFSAELQDAISAENGRLGYNMPPPELDKFIKEITLERVMKDVSFGFTDKTISASNTPLPELKEINLFMENNTKYDDSQVYDAREALHDKGIPVTYASLLNELRGE